MQAITCRQTPDLNQILKALPSGISLQECPRNRHNFLMQTHFGFPVFVSGGWVGCVYPKWSRKYWFVLMWTSQTARTAGCYPYWEIRLSTYSPRVLLQARVKPATFCLSSHWRLLEKQARRFKVSQFTWLTRYIGGPCVVGKARRFTWPKHPPDDLNGSRFIRSSKHHF